jgi:hypothetical protein
MVIVKDMGRVWVMAMPKELVFGGVKVKVKVKVMVMVMV